MIALRQIIALLTSLTLFMTPLHAVPILSFGDDFSSSGSSSSSLFSLGSLYDTPKSCPASDPFSFSSSTSLLGTDFFSLDPEPKYSFELPPLELRPPFKAAASYDSSNDCDKPKFSIFDTPEFNIGNWQDFDSLAADPLDGLADKGAPTLLDELLLPKPDVASIGRCVESLKQGPIEGNPALQNIVNSLKNNICGLDGSSYASENKQQYCGCVVKNYEKGVGYYKEVKDKVERYLKSNIELRKSMKEALIKHQLNQVLGKYRTATNRILQAALIAEYSDPILKEEQNKALQVCMPGGMEALIDQTVEKSNGMCKGVLNEAFSNLEKPEPIQWQYGAGFTSGQGQMLLETAMMGHSGGVAGIPEQERVPASTENEEANQNSTPSEDKTVGMSKVRNTISNTVLRRSELRQRRASGLSRGMHGPPMPPGSSALGHASEFEKETDTILFTLFHLHGIDVPSELVYSHDPQTLNQMLKDDRVRSQLPSIVQMGSKITENSTPREIYLKGVNDSITKLILNPDAASLDDNNRVRKFLKSEPLFSGIIDRAILKHQKENQGENPAPEKILADFLNQIKSEIERSGGNKSIAHVLSQIGGREAHFALYQCQQTHTELADLCLKLADSKSDDEAIKLLIGGNNGNDGFMEDVIADYSQKHGNEKGEEIRDKLEIFSCITQKEQALDQREGDKPIDRKVQARLAQAGLGASTNIMPTAESFNQTIAQGISKVKRDRGIRDEYIPQLDMNNSVIRSPESIGSTIIPVKSSSDESSSESGQSTAAFNSPSFNTMSKASKAMPNFVNNPLNQPTEIEQQDLSSQSEKGFSQEKASINALEERINALVSRLKEVENKKDSASEKNDTDKEASDPELEKVQRELAEARESLKRQKIALAEKREKKKKANISATKKATPTPTPIRQQRFTEAARAPSDNNVVGQPSNQVSSGSTQVFTGGGKANNTSSDGIGVLTNGVNLISENAFQLQDGSYYLVSGQINSIDDIDLGEAVRAAGGKKIIVPDQNSSTGFVELIVEEDGDGFKIAEVLEVTLEDEKKKGRSIASQGQPDFIPPTEEKFIGPVRDVKKLEDAVQILRTGISKQ